MLKMRKIVFIVNHEIVIYNFRKEIVEAFLENKDKVYIISPNGNRIQKLQNLGANHLKININRRGINPIQDIILYFKLKKMIKKIHPDIIFTFTIKPNIYGGLVSRALKIKHVANITGLGSAFSKKGILRTIIRKLYLISFKKSRVIYVQNNQNLEYMKKMNIYPQKLVLLPGSGVNLKEYKCIDYPKQDIINFVFIARVMKEKGIEEYLKAANEIKKEFNNVNFHVCGFLEDEYKGKLSEAVSNGDVIYHGLINNSRDILKSSHCLIHPSYYPEGISNVILEASASCRPVITTNMPGCKDAIIEGRTGFIFKSKNHIDLIEKIKMFLELPFSKKIQMGIDARKYVEINFDRSIVVQRYLDCLGDNNEKNSNI
jgi:glycosyltransferase involved in cell wall biosynthesis